jgi:formylglycine-generating enzyme required for sulfatase activity
MRAARKHVTSVGPLAFLALLAFTAGCGKEDEPPAPPAPADERTQAPGPPTARAAEPAAFATPTGVEMVLIPAGQFTMGDDGGEPDERPAHPVELSAFAMDRYEVTQEAYQNLMGTNPSRFVGPDRPVEQVSWLAAVRYCNMRSLSEGLRPCYDAETLECDYAADGYRLPTEAEWEYACRAGTATDYSFGNQPRRLKDHAWFGDNSRDTTHPVGQKDANPWGLHDMHGNVAEWCNDFYAEGYDPSLAGVDPRGPAEGDERVLRGGSWRSTADACRCSARYSEPPGLADVCFGYEAYGFRCVKAAPSEPAR